MRFKEYNQKQMWLIPPNIEDEIPPGDICRVIDDVIESIDTKQIEEKYKEEGNPAYHPKMMLKVLFYSYSQGVFSSRKIAQELERNIFYWYLSGKQQPDFRTICLFRTKQTAELKMIFREVVRYCIKLGIARIATVTLDGTKIKANANRDKMRNEEWLEKQILIEAEGLEKALEEAGRIDDEEDKRFGKDQRGDEIPDEIQDRKKRLEKLEKLKREMKKSNLRLINETDTDIGLMRSQGNYLAGYNCQAVVDVDSQVILAADVVGEANDWNQLKGNIEEIKTAYGEKPKTLLADAGYCSGSNLAYLKDEEIEGIIPDKSIKEIRADIEPAIIGEKKFNKDNFKYDKEHDCYICPEGEKLKKQGCFPVIAVRKSGEKTQYFQYQCYRCHKCRFKKECCTNKRGRCITRYFDEELREEMAQKIRSQEGYELYKQRLKTAEPVFGNIKHNLGFHVFSLRGLIKTRGEFFLATTAHNLVKIKKWLEKLKREAQMPTWGYHLT